MRKFSILLALLFLCAFLFSYSQAGEVRTWTSGSYSVEGEFIELTENGTIVRIRKSNGKVTRVLLTKLSQEDQEYIKEEVENPFEDENPEIYSAETALSALPSKPQRKVLMVDGIEYAFRWCPPGEFIMGAPESEWPDRLSSFPYDETPHKVKLTKGFWMLETEVTQAMWQSVMGESIESKAKQGTLDTDLKGIGDNYPMYFVSSDDCEEFCKKLSKKLGQQIQLPTEAQWEYACRAGSTESYAGDLDSMAWYSSTAQGRTHEVGQKKPNAWGLYDMHGNVYEWCSDYYDEKYYENSPKIDPENTEVSSDRVHRGGCWIFDAEYCRSACRLWGRYDSRLSIDGFRIILVPGSDE